MDVRNGFVSADSARSDYAVVVTEDFTVDLPKTAALRSA
jgi:hypothetical protein